MRDEDAETGHKVQAELRDIHHRIDSLKDENERQYNDLKDKLHGLEVAVARGSRFPATAWVAAVGIVVSVVGTGSILYTKLDHAGQDAGKALTLIETHLSGASARLQAIQDISKLSDEWQRKLPALDERCQHLIKRIDAIEYRQEHICERVKQCSGAGK